VNFCAVLQVLLVGVDVGGDLDALVGLGSILWNRFRRNLRTKLKTSPLQVYLHKSTY
jgi:hypothetical protein